MSDEINMQQTPTHEGTSVHPDARDHLSATEIASMLAGLSAHDDKVSSSLPDEGLRLLRAFTRITSPTRRMRIVELVEAFADHNL